MSTMPFFLFFDKETT